MSYGVDIIRNYYRAAAFVGRLLRGAAPSDVPTERTSPVLAINLKTAAEQRFEFPVNILAIADVVIE